MTPEQGLNLIERYGRELTRRQRQVLRMMAADDGEDGLLVYERGRGYVGLEPISARTLYALLRACAIRLIDGEAGGFEVYAINSTGRRLARPPIPARPVSSTSRGRDAAR